MPGNHCTYVRKFLIKGGRAYVQVHNSYGPDSDKKDLEVDLELDHPVFYCLDMFALERLDTDNPGKKK